MERLSGADPTVDEQIFKKEWKAAEMLFDGRFYDFSAGILLNRFRKK